LREPPTRGCPQWQRDARSDASGTFDDHRRARCW
jgi:hypothetical protein